MPEKFEEFIKENAPGPDGERRDKKPKEEDPGFFRRYVRRLRHPAHLMSRFARPCAVQR
jgi:hypothetical protein